MQRKFRNRFCFALSDNRKSKIENQKCLAVFAFALALVFYGAVAQAQQSGKIPRVGYVSLVSAPSKPSRNHEAFLRGLRDLGYVHKKNIVVEFRYGQGRLDRLPSLITELLQLPIDVLVSGDDNTIRFAKDATKTIPIVMVINHDPVATGIVDSLARPGRNITGISRLTRELSGKRLELLTELNPGMTRVGILWDVNGEGSKISFKEYEAAARLFRIQLKSLVVSGPNPDLAVAFQLAAKERVNALVVIGGQLLNRHRPQITNYAIQHRLPAIYESTQWIEPGGLVSYLSDDAESYRRAAWYVDKILKGAKPADLPVEQARKFELVINLRTAKQLGLTIPPTILGRADRVIQ